MKSNNNTLNECPKGLDKSGSRAYSTIVDLLRSCNATNTSGCTTFYSPEEWEERGEKYGTGSVLVVVHEGGDVPPFFNLDYGDYKRVEKMEEALHKAGLWVQQCTSWYSAVYPL